jgi:hypothetical protein
VTIFGSVQKIDNAEKNACFEDKGFHVSYQEFTGTVIGGLQVALF